MRLLETLQYWVQNLMLEKMGRVLALLLLVVVAQRRFGKWPWCGSQRGPEAASSLMSVVPVCLYGDQC